MSAKYRVEPDGTRVYHRSGNRYKPKALEDRKIGVNKPDDPTAIRFYGVWVIPHVFLDDALREMPATREDREAYEHMRESLHCRCDVCVRPYADWYRFSYAQKELGIQKGKSNPYSRIEPSSS